jgi:hypothetical protein
LTALQDHNSEELEVVIVKGFELFGLMIWTKLLSHGMSFPHLGTCCNNCIGHGGMTKFDICDKVEVNYGLKNGLKSSPNMRAAATRHPQF